MDLGFWSRGGQLIGRHPNLTPRAGFVDVPEHTARLSVLAEASAPQVWLLSVDGRREECAWDSGDWPTCEAGVRVLAVAEYSDGRVLTRTFCVDHGQTWAEGLTLHAAVHDMRYREDVPAPPEPGHVTRSHAINPGAVGHNTVLLLDGRRLRVQRYIHKTTGELHVWAHEQFTAGGEGPEEHIDLGKPEHLYVID